MWGLMTKSSFGGRRLRIGSLAVLSFLVVLFAAQLSEAGRVASVRTYVRLERLWARDFPVTSARGWLRRLDPALSSVGLLGPVRVELEPGVSLLLDPADDIGRTVLVSRAGQWEPEVWEAISGYLKPGGVFLDVGAHIGIDSLKASVLVGPLGTVVAFEPNPTTVVELRNNLSASHASNINIQTIALTDVEQPLTLFDSRGMGNSGSSSLSSDNAGDAGTPYVVRGRRLDDVVKELSLTRIDLIKADVEGAELLVLTGGIDTLRRFHPALILEVVPRQLENMGASVEKLESLLRSLGYSEGRWVDYKNKEYVAGGGA